MAASKKTRKWKSLNAVEKAQAIQMWSMGLAGDLEELSQQFRCSPKTLERLFAKSGVKKGAEKDKIIEDMREKIRAQIAEQMKAEVGVWTERIRSTKEDNYKTFQLFNGMLKKGAVESFQTKQAYGLKNNDVKTILASLQALKIIREELWVIMGIADGEERGKDDLPELPIIELNAEQVRQIQSEQDSLTDTLEQGLSEFDTAASLPPDEQDDGAAP